MDLFEYIKLVFKKDGLENVPSNIIKKHSFMLLRFVSIKYPVQACLMSEIGANDIYIAKYWNVKLSQMHNGQVPPWIYTKIAPKKDSSLDKIFEDKEVVKRFLYENDFDLKEFDFLKKLDIQGLTIELNNIDKVMKKEKKGYE